LVDKLSRGNNKKNKKHKPQPRPDNPLPIVAVGPNYSPAEEPSKTERDGQLSKTTYALEKDSLVWRATLIVGVIAAFIYGLQWYQMRKSMENDERPWIEVATGKVPQPNTNSPLVTPLTFTNIGKTPARKVEIETVVKVVLSHEAIDFSYQPSIGGSTGIVFPNEPAPAVDARTIEEHQVRNLTVNELDNLTHGKAFVITYASVSYEDVFGNAHWTHQCFFYQLTPPADAAAYDTAACVAYNDTDHDH
jgi:hypothetical protein